MTKSRNRLAAIGHMRSVADESEARQLASVIKKLKTVRRPKGAADSPAWVWDSEADLVVRELERRLLPAGRGAPERMAYFHHWIAVDYLWRRSIKRVAKVAYYEVGEAWGIAKASVEKAVRENRPSASDHVRLGTSDPPYAELLQTTIAFAADMFKIIAEPTTLAKQEEATRRTTKSRN